MNTVKAFELYNFMKRFGNDVSLVGDEEAKITGISSLANYKEGSLTWIKPGTDIGENQKVALTAVVLSKEIDVSASVKFYVNNPKFFFFKAAELLVGSSNNAVIAPSAVLSESAKIGKGVSIGPYSCIGKNTVIGENTQIGSHVIIENDVIVGNNCCIKSGAIIGGKGFGYSKVDDLYFPIPHYGGIVIGNYVDIGSNTCIDKGTLDNTIIKDGVKIDNLCHIAHNVIIEENCCIVANTTIGGSVKISKGSYVGISASIQNQKKIGTGSIVGMGAVVTKDVLENHVVAFSPARVIRKRTQTDFEKY